MAHEVNTYWKNVLTIVPIVGAGMATIIYLLRLYCRRMKAVSLQLEDYLMGVGLILSYGVTASVLFTAFNGVGLPIKSLPKYERKNIQFGTWMIQKFWPPSMAFVKISIVVFIKQLFGLIRAYVILSNCLIGFIATWALAGLLVNIFQCIPVQYYYNKDLEGHCMGGQVQFFQTMGSIALIEDVAILCLPIPVFWKLQINNRQKITLILVFSLGGVVCIFSLMRLIEFRQFQVTDLAVSSAKESIWTCLELDVAVICGCLPFLNPLVKGVRSKVRSDASKYHSQPSTGSNFHSHTRGNKANSREHHSGCGAIVNSNSREAMVAASWQSSDIENNRQNVDSDMST
ncbi:uncharacterized protein N7479_011052 [Penicillium vulpinum]|uniref:uncharacterized protein n=1 Tax=Penicillium vulpinum TaxID=29845 RepID=UPI002547AD72|nr:uncharacterized protein N7479_011052 [Penicillium vulpinum]KAJ5952639.1 hypothetical protein N7479_011052 [Penicillium vulpinum]